MCGIAGIYSKRGAPIPENQLDRMLDLLEHRGPDDRGTLALPHLHMGMVRLSIIDLETGHQPIWTHDKAQAIVLNGEIYNYPALRKELESTEKLKTQSDTETLLVQYRRHGLERFLDDVTGMYAFGIWDETHRRLILGRDRFGEKPLFYWETPDHLYFASEIKALLTVAPREMHPQAIWDFLTLCYVPEPQSAFKDIKELPPSSLMVLENGSVDIRRYWRLSLDEDPSMDEEEAINGVREHFQQAVTERLVADVPVGIFLSGGLDSNAILSVFHKQYQQGTIRSYTAQFDQASYDESDTVRHIVNEYGIENDIVPCHFEDLVENFDDIIRHCDNLHANTAILPNYLLARRAHEDLKVVLHGGGGDEVFFGYPTYVADFGLATVPGLRHISRLMLAALNHLPASSERVSWHYKLCKFFEGAHLPLEKAHYYWRTILTEPMKEELLTSIRGEDTYHCYRSYMETEPGRDFFTRAAHADLRVFWTSLGNYQADAISMAKSLEMRLPFLDHKLIQYVYTVPRRYRFRGLQKKRIFRKAVQGIIPESLFSLPKGGFHVPLAYWFCEPRGKQWLQDQLSRERVEQAGICHWDAVSHILESHWQHRRDASFQIFNLLVLHTWHRLYIA